MRIGIDIGGTFTDIVAVRDDGGMELHKLPSTPDDYGRAIVDGTEAVMGRPGSAGDVVTEIVHGTTVAANAILSGTGARTGLITTRGFRDVLEIGRLRVPKLYDLTYEKPAPLVPRRLRVEVEERVNAGGEVQVPLDEDSLSEAIGFLESEEVASVAVCLLNAYANPVHEERIGALLRERGAWRVTLSTEVLPEIREFERTSTTVVNAYVLPVVQAYLSGLRDRLDAIGVRTPLRMMQSAGGIMDADTAAERPVQVIESGPAAGVVAAAALGSRIGQPDMIALDMGGTTAKAALIEGGRVPRATDYEVGGGISLAGRLMGGGGYPIRVPCIDLAEIGAGGGSLLRLDAGGALQVGPESAGADPGPACYARGGTQPTLTDANLALGYLNPDGLTGGTMPLDADAARRSLSEEVAGPMGLSVEAAALGAHRIAVALMVRAVRAVSAERGRDPRRFEMLAFGGSGPLHAVAMAREMGIARVRIPGAPGLFSAFGLLVAGHQLDRVRSCLRRVSDLTEDEVRDAYREMAEEAEEALPGARLERSADLRYVGQSFELTVPVAGDVQKPGFLAGLREAFEGEHERTYGHRAESDPVEVVAWRLRATLPAPEMPLLEPSVSDGRERTQRAYFGDRDGWIETPVLGRGGLPSEPCTGPMIVEDYDATTLVPPGAEPWLDEWGNIVVDCGRH